MTTAAVSLSCDGAAPSVDPEVAEVAGAADRAAGDVAAALELARTLGPDAPLPAAGDTRQRWELLATLAAADLTVARVVEPHLDALAILAEARADGLDVGDPDAAVASTWGVFASEGPQSTVRLSDGRISGTKPWCSLADRLDRALLTVATDAGSTLVSTDLRAPGATATPATGWVAHGLPDVTSVPVDFDAVDASTVGAPGWYLERPGFWWGGIGVAACWFGGAVPLARAAHRAVHRRTTDVGAVQLARVDLALYAARSVLNEAAALADSGPVADTSLIAQRCRAVVAYAVETVLTEAGHLLGPAPLAFDAAHVQRVSDLTLYVRQHHADRDLTGVGRSLAGSGTPPW